MDPDTDPAIFVIDLEDANKKCIAALLKSSATGFAFFYEILIDM
jgi:hypothetical protein